jgi:hypothetical protein
MFCVVASAVFLAMSIGACSGGHEKASVTTTTTVSPAIAAGENLQSLIITAPVGFAEDQTSGADGAISPRVFSQFGGSKSASEAGFVAGYRENYVDGYSPDAVSVTLMKFDNAQSASAYFTTTGRKTLNFAAATVTPFSLIPGALSVAGTKEYAGEWANGIVFATGPYYVSVVYVNADQGAPPGELKQWAKTQWLMLN